MSRGEVWSYLAEERPLDRGDIFFDFLPSFNLHLQAQRIADTDWIPLKKFQGSETCKEAIRLYSGRPLVSSVGYDMESFSREGKTALPLFWQPFRHPLLLALLSLASSSGYCRLQCRSHPPLACRDRGGPLPLHPLPQAP